MNLSSLGDIVAFPRTKKTKTKHTEVQEKSSKHIKKIELQTMNAATSWLMPRHLLLFLLLCALGITTANHLLPSEAENLNLRCLLHCLHPSFPQCHCF